MKELLKLVHSCQKIVVKRGIFTAHLEYNERIYSTGVALKIVTTT